MKACFQGITVELAGISDMTTFQDFSVTISYSDTTEAVSTNWVDGSSVNKYSFSSNRLLKHKPDNVSLKISYVEKGVAKDLSAKSDVNWTAFVCNQCSGDYSACKDDYNHAATIKWDLKSLL